MKFDKETISVVILCLAVMIGWQPFCNYMGWNTTHNTQGAAVSVADSTSVSAKPAETIPVLPDSQKNKPVSNLPTVDLSNSKLTLTINPNIGAISKITLLDYRNSKRDDCVSIPHAGALALSGEGNWRILAVKGWVITPGHYKLVRIVDTDYGRFELIQNWILGKNDYQTEVSFSLRNLGKKHLLISKLELSGGELSPWKWLSGDKVRIPSHRLDYLTANGDYGDIDADKKDSKFFCNPPPAVKWAAVSNKYVCSILSEVRTPFILSQKRYYAEPGNGEDKYPVISVGASLGSVNLAPGAVKDWSFSFYSGPKIIEELNKFDSSTNRVMHLAWGPLDYLARALLWLLVKLHALCGSYGWSIVLLTLLVRMVFYPITARGNSSMKKMQSVQPKLKALREKYKDNPQLMNQKMMELYRSEGVNPFGGCLPILLQIPVFFALYATLDGAVELRQVPFYWCTDLAAADTVARINLYFFTLPINPLALAMTGLMALQQHLTPMSMDPTQKKMMALMPLIMLIFLYDLPSGLTLYWTVSNIFSIIQLRLQQRNRVEAPQRETESSAVNFKKGK